jgi:hypothetical protein
MYGGFNPQTRHHACKDIRKPLAFEKMGKSSSSGRIPYFAQYFYYHSEKTYCGPEELLKTGRIADEYLIQTMKREPNAFISRAFNMLPKSAHQHAPRRLAWFRVFIST